MLSELEIENLAVISHAQIQFSPKLNVFTGETGAGKSILIHGIRAILGERVSRDIVRTGRTKAVITARFSNLDTTVCHILDNLSIAHEDDELLLTREIHADGKSTARVSGHTTTAAILREIGANLIDIHGQHDNQILLRPESHLDILDAYGGDDNYLKRYQDTFHRLQQTAKRLSKLTRQEQQQQQRRQYLMTMIADCDAVDVTMGEETALESELEILQNAQIIMNGLTNAANALDSYGNNNNTAISLVRNARDELSSFTNLRTDFETLSQRLDAVNIELDDIASECRNLAEQVDLDTTRYEIVQKRLQDIARLCRDYHCSDGDNLVATLEKAHEELDQMQNNNEEIQELRKEREILLKDASTKAQELYEYREDALQRFSKEVCAQLAFLDMPDVVLTGNHTTGKLTLRGSDNLEFLISANRGEEPRPLSRIASGGELSRIMLALKCAIADRDQTPTMIFDEIDTGISGRAAQKVGRKLHEVSQTHQVLCVTHLSQIAVMADQHIHIQKQVLDEHTQTQVTILEGEERVTEIARIMGGDNPSELLLNTAREELARNTEAVGKWSS